MNKNLLNNFGRGPPKDHIHEIISKLDKGFIHIGIKGEVGAPLNRFKPSSKIFY